jgi:L-ascorbate metabolism protein UlaG (beta-lactamase superfamily)
MHITQLRNATVVLEFESKGLPVRLLVDPMLAPRAALPSLKWLTGKRRRNPLVDLPERSNEVLASVTHALITHCQRGHFDHLDRAGKHFLRERRIPVFCTPHDEPYLRARGLNAQPLSSVERALLPWPHLRHSVRSWRGVGGSGDGARGGLLHRAAR